MESSGRESVSSLIHVDGVTSCLPFLLVFGEGQAKQWEALGFKHHMDSTKDMSYWSKSKFEESLVSRGKQAQTLGHDRKMGLPSIRPSQGLILSPVHA